MEELQERLLLALADGAETDDVVRQALADAPDPATAAWVAGWDPELVGLAGVLVRTWAYRKGPGA